MNAILMCTINYFPGYKMVFGLRTREKLACVHCMENNKTFILTNSGKVFFYYHQRFWLTNNKYRNNKKNFFIGRVEKDVAPSVQSGE